MACTVSFSPGNDADFFEQIPAAAAVFVLHGDGEPYISKTANLLRRLQRLLGPPTELSKRLNLRDRVREVQFTPTGSDFESQILLYRLLRENFPDTYARRLRLRNAPLVKLHLDNAYPRVSVTTRLSRPATRGERHDSTANVYYGPFASRAAAEKFSTDALDFFKMRRCVEDLNPDPAFPGCVYSEMKMCLAPCFKGCTDPEYRAEVTRVQDFFDTQGDSLRREFADLRDRASASLAFEEAAAIHAKLEKLKPLLSQLPEIVRRISELRALIIQAAAKDAGDAVSLFVFQDCALHGPVRFSVAAVAESRSMASRIEEVLAGFPYVQAKTTVEHAEHLAMLKRWYYRSSRVGEVFFPDQDGHWPMRRVVRGVARVAKGEKPEEMPAFPASPQAPSTSLERETS